MTFYDALLETRPSRAYLLFVCHAWNYDDDYEGVVNLLNSDSSFEWSNLSVPKNNPLPSLFRLPRSYRHLCRELDGLISKADCVLVLDAMYAAHRGWMQSEIEAAQEFGKPIVAIAPRGQERFPEVVRYAADARVGWSSASIINAIRRLVTGLGTLSVHSAIASLVGESPRLAGIGSPPPLGNASASPSTGRALSDLLENIVGPPSIRPRPGVSRLR
jgi:hypothetical protein